MDRKNQRNSLDLTKLRELINKGEYLSIADKKVSLLSPKLIATHRIEIKFSPLEDFATEDERKRERYLCFEERCSRLGADCYVRAWIKGTFPNDEVYSLVFFKFK